MNTGKCPKCEALITTVKTEPATAKAPGEKQAQEGVFYLCPECETILGVQFAPITLQQEALETHVD